MPQRYINTHAMTCLTSYEIKRLEASIKDERKKLEYPKRKNKRIMENAFSNTRNVSPVITKSEIKSYY